MASAPLPKPAKQPLRERLLTAFSGQSDGQPKYVREIAEGDDEGFFGPDSAVWVVHGDLPTLVAGIRALLMQTLHPGAMAGVHDWSRYKTDSMGRLAGTIRWIVCTTFGSTEQAVRESDRVKHFHERVVGTYVDGTGAEKDYRAGDGDLLRWVHLAFTEAFLGSQQTFGGPIPGGADQYVREWAVAGALVDAPDSPTSEAELRAALDKFRTDGVLRRDERVDEAVRFLKKPPLPGTGIAYRVLFGGAVASIPVEYRRLLGLRRPWWPAVTLTRVVLWAVGIALGTGPSSRSLGQARVARLRSANVES